MASHPIPKDILPDFTTPPSVNSQDYFISKVDKLENLRNSTKRLLCLIEELQSKTRSSNQDDSQKLSIALKNQNSGNVPPEDIATSVAVKTLELQTSNIDEINIQERKDDCSVYKRLTRECHCLNNAAYNDFIIHFNEDTKYLTTTRGEIIKNMRIVKKFLYMGGGYSKNALTFLHDGLMNSKHCERLEMVQACVYADICNIFDDNSIVTVCVLWPEKYDTYGDSKTQKITADILTQLVQVEEGRRYLTFNSKISTDIKKLLKKRTSTFNPELIESLNSTLNALNPPLTRNINVSYYMKGQEGSGYRTLQTLERYKMYLTIEEIIVHLELLHSLSKQEEGKKELMQNFALLLKLFKEILLEYDSSDLNIQATNILINLMSKKPEDTSELPKSYVVSEIATEPVKMVSEVLQVPAPMKKAPYYRNYGSRNREVSETNCCNPSCSNKRTKGCVLNTFDRLFKPRGGIKFRDRNKME